MIEGHGDDLYKYGKKIVKLFRSIIIRMLLATLESNFYSGSRTMMTISNINLLNTIKCFLNCCNICWITYFKHAVTNTVLCRKII